LVVWKLFCNFAKWIDGSREPLTRVIQQPFHFTYLLESLSVGNKMKRLTTQEFIDRARQVHGDKYDYSKVNYVNANTNVCIVCKTHGEFMQLPFTHIKGSGCPLCANEKVSKDYTLSKDEFVRRSISIHGDKYDYSLVNYKSASDKVKIICPIHGVFEKSPHNHWKGQGCPACVNHEPKMSTQRYVEKAKNVWGDVYDYSQVEYVNSKQKIKIICREHGLFYQEPQHHLQGSGCPLCKSSRGENVISKFLNDNNIPFLRQRPFVNDNIFAQRKHFVVDFYIQESNVIIEYNGIQHYEPIGRFGGKESFIQQQERDMALRQYCKEHKMKLIEIPYTEYNNIETILKKELKIK